MYRKRKTDSTIPPRKSRRLIAKNDAHTFDEELDLCVHPSSVREGIDANVDIHAPCHDVFIRCRVKAAVLEKSDDALMELVIRALAHRSGAPDNVFFRLSYFFQWSVVFKNEIIMLVRCPTHKMSPLWTANVVSELLESELDDKPLLNLLPQAVVSSFRADVIMKLIEYINPTPFATFRLPMNQHNCLDVLKSSSPAKRLEWRGQEGYVMMLVQSTDPDPKGEIEIPVVIDPIKTLRAHFRNTHSKQRMLCSVGDEETKQSAELERVVDVLSRTNPTAVVKIKDTQKDYSTTHSKKRKEWLDFVSRLPVGRGSLPNLVNTSSPSNASVMLEQAETELDAVVHGMYGARNAVMEMAGRCISSAVERVVVSGTPTESPSLRAILLEGPPGSGKTTFAMRAMGNALKRPVRMINVGGAKDASTLIGHSYTYEGSRPGRIMEEIVASGVIDPILVFDEVDKISDTSHGHEIANVLMSLVDPTQNHAFTDTYMAGVPIDLSNVLVVMTCNDASLVNRILLDRVRVVRVPALTPSELITITKNYVFPRTLRNNGFFNAEPLSDETARLLIREGKKNERSENHTIDPNSYTTGMRSIEKLVERVVLNANLRCIRNDDDGELRITSEDVDDVCRMIKEENRLIEEAFARSGAKSALTSMYT